MSTEEHSETWSSVGDLPDIEEQANNVREELEREIEKTKAYVDRMQDTIESSYRWAKPKSDRIGRIGVVGFGSTLPVAIYWCFVGDWYTITLGWALVLLWSAPMLQNYFNLGQREDTVRFIRVGPATIPMTYFYITLVDRNPDNKLFAWWTMVSFFAFSALGIHMIYMWRKYHMKITEGFRNIQT